MVKPMKMVDPMSWGWSIADTPYLETLVAARVLLANTDPACPVWIALGSETEPKPPSGYVVHLVRLHEWGFGFPTGRFIRALCHHYGVELHNFSPNAIS